ncbi:MAG: GGDEF domain-containing protein [Clostridia bacterium]|nr:GGDEF domain-containing protein [Clostridia bacterium]
MGSINRRNSFDRGVFLVLGAVLAAAALLCTGISLLPSAHGIAEGRNLSENVRVDVVRGDGTTLTDAARSEWHGRKGDDITIHVAMPGMQNYDDAYLVFSAYNSTLEMSCDGVPVKGYLNDNGERVDAGEYLQRLADQGRMIGHMEFLVPVPEAAWGNELTLDLKPQTGVSFQRFDGFLLMPGPDARFAALVGREGQFVIFGALVMLGFLGLLAGLVGMAFRQEMQRVALGSAFVMISSVWFFASRGFLFTLVENVRFCAMMEYFALLAAPVFLSFYMWACVEENFHRQVCKVAGIIFTFLGVVLTLTDLLGGQVFGDMMLPFTIMLIAAVAVFGALAVRNHLEEPADQRELVIFIGTMTSLVLILLELTGDCLESTVSMPAALLALTRVDFAAGALFVGFGIMIFSHFTKVQSVIAEQVRKDTLEEMALIDPMTELPARASVIADIRRLRASDRYAILFLDVNGINLANSQYGHETGDKLLKTVAEAVRNTFEDGDYDGFYGRWGGDEFVVFLNSMEDAEEFRESFRERIKELNEGKLRSGLPFRIDVPVGISFHARNDTRNVKQCLVDAEHQMYVNKLSRRTAR